MFIQEEKKMSHTSGGVKEKLLDEALKEYKKQNLKISEWLVVGHGAEEALPERILARI